MPNDLVFTQDVTIPVHPIMRNGNEMGDLSWLDTAVNLGDRALANRIRAHVRDRMRVTIPAGTALANLNRVRTQGGNRLTIIGTDATQIIMDHFFGEGAIKISEGNDYRAFTSVGTPDSIRAKAWERTSAYRTMGYYRYREPNEVGAFYSDDAYALAVHFQGWDRERLTHLRAELRLRIGESSKKYDEFRKPIRSGGGDFVKYAQALREKLVVTPNPLSQMVVLPHGTLSSRRWGIEIEAVDIAGVDTPKYWDLREDGSLRSLNDDDGYREHDGDCDYVEDYTEECNCGYEDYYDNYSDTGEFTSPILRSYHSRGLEYLCSMLEHRPTNTTPGIHVHVEASDLSPSQVGRVQMIYSLLEPLFESEYKRSVREYCRSIAPQDVLSVLRTLRKIQADKGHRATTQLGYFTERYRTVNLNALAAHGTIEFRAMGPRYNYETLTRWAQFCREIVNIAAANVPQNEWRKVRTFTDLLDLFSRYGKETPTPGEKAPRTTGAVSTALGNENRRNANYNAVARDVFEDYTRRVVQMENGLEPSFQTQNFPLPTITMRASEVGVTPEFSRTMLADWERALLTGAVSA